MSPFPFKDVTLIPAPHGLNVISGSSQETYVIDPVVFFAHGTMTKGGGPRQHAMPCILDRETGGLKLVRSPYDALDADFDSTPFRAFVFTGELQASLLDPTYGELSDPSSSWNRIYTPTTLPEPLMSRYEASPLDRGRPNP